MIGATLLYGRIPRLAPLRLLSFSLISFVLLTASVSAQYCTPDQCDECNLCRCSQRCCHELPELWLINTRCAPRCKNLDSGFDCLIYKRYDRQCCRWVRESRETFLAQESSMPTLFYSHGNSLNHKNAMKSCWKIYCKMRCCPGQKRLVFWSWPAERVVKTQGLRVREMISKNLRIKYVYAEYQAYYMAKLVHQMSLSQRVMLSGHSYGAITSAVALHYLGGGCLRGLTLEGGAAVERPNLRGAIISGAFDHDMLNPGHRYGQAFVAGEKIYVTRNIKDRTLKKWPNTSWRGCRAIGVLGVNANRLGEYRNKLCQQTMTDDVGTSHYLTPHLKSVKFVSALCCLSFPECSECSISECPINDSECPINEHLVADVDLPTEAEILFDVVPDEQLAAEAQFILNDGLELASRNYANEFEEFSLLADSNLTPTDISDVFGADGLYDERNLNVTAHSQPHQRQPIADQVGLSAPVQSPAAPTPAAAQRQTAGNAGNHHVLYRGGLCLALVLAIFSKRIATS